jgi:hypothetical protein
VGVRGGGIGLKGSREELGDAGGGRGRSEDLRSVRGFLAGMGRGFGALGEGTGGVRDS